MVGNKVVKSEDIQQACDEFFVTDFINQLENGWDTNVGLQGNNLSGGQRQRISLARARLRNTPIMIFDESFSALDPRMRSKCLQAIRKYRADKTTIIITHELAQINSNDYLYIMENGKVIEEGVREDLEESDSPKFMKLFETTNLNKPSEVFPSRNSRRYSANPDNRLSWIGEDIRQKRKSITNFSENVLSSNTEDEYVESKLADWQKKKKISTIKILMLLIKTLPNKNLFILGLISAVVNGLTTPVFSFAFSNLLNGIISQNDPSTSWSNLTKWSIIVVAIGVADGITTYGLIFLDIASEKWLRYIRALSLKKILDKELLEFTGDTASALTSLIMNDLESGRLILSRFVSSIASCIVLGLFAIIWSMVTGWQLTLVGVSLIPLFYVASTWYKRMVTKWESVYRTETNSIIGLIDEVVSGIKSVKLLSLEKYFKEEVEKRERQLNGIAFRRAVFIGLGYGINHIFMYLTQGIILYYGMKLIADQKYSVQGSMIVFTLLIFSLVSLEQSIGTIPILSNGFETCRDILDLIRGGIEKENVSHFEEIKHGSIKFDQVEFRYLNVSEVTTDEEVEYNNNKLVLNKLSLNIDSNEVVAVTGPSGCGKSTIAGLIANLYKPQGGDIYIDGKNIKEFDTTKLRKRIAIVNQMPLSFFEGTIADNLKYGIEETVPEVQKDKMIRQACRESGLDKFITENLVDKYETKIGNSNNSGSLLSGGQLQRLGIARALVRNPKILILDECTSALDAESVDIIKQMIKYHRTVRDMTIIIITHQEEMTEGVDRVIHI